MTPRPNNPNNAWDALGKSAASQMWELHAETTHLHRLIIVRLHKGLRRMFRLPAHRHRYVFDRWNVHSDCPMYRCVHCGRLHSDIYYQGLR